MDDLFQTGATYQTSQSTSELSDLTYSWTNRDITDNNFHMWARSVGLNVTIHDENLPEPLRNILHASHTVPRWILNENAPEYESCRHQFRDIIKILSFAARAHQLVLDDNNQLSEDVRDSLYPILLMPLHDSILHRKGSVSSCTDRRAPLDVLLMHTWDYQVPGFQFSQRNLEIPRTSATDQKTVDSTVHIQLPEPGTHPSGPSLPLLLHWVIEYEHEGCEDSATRQVLKGMVSGLYQRRALGFKDHFVFGMAHHSTRLLDVFAATWENPEPPTSTDVNWIYIPAMETEDEDEGRDDEILSNENKTDRFRRDQFKRPLTPRMIVVYCLGTFNMGSAPDMLRLYLLMRDARELGCEYKTAILNALPGPLVQQNSVELVKLPVSSRSPSPTESSGKCKKRQCTQEIEGDAE